MEFRQLKYFVAIAEELHFGNAANKLFVSQSALSQQIQLLENEIGIELFVRIKRKQQRKVELTEAGMAFLIDAKKILQLSQKAVENARRIGLHQEIIRLGVYKMLLKERIIEVISLFSKHFPTVEMKIVELPTYQSIQESLMNETIDLGLTLLPLIDEKLTAKTTLQGHLKVIMSINHPMAKEEILKLSDLKNEKWVEISKPLHPFYDEIENACQEAGFNRIPNIIQEVSSLELLCSLVSLGIGIAFVPSLFNLCHIEGIMVKNVLKDENSLFERIKINHAVAYKNNSISPLIEAFMGLVGE